MFSEEVLRNQLVNEETVEAIIRKRSLDGKSSSAGGSADDRSAFKSRCPFFYPAESDLDGKKLWEAADRGRIVHVETASL